MRLPYCAVCGREITIGFDLCRDCRNQWTCTGTLPKPEWLKYLVRAEYKFHQGKAGQEIVFADMSIEFQEQMDYPTETDP